jgi:curved DNA-binding protein CbpA
MQCHYEVLQVTQDATQDVLKVAYRKIALQWHPGGPSPTCSNATDKNSDRLEEATAMFQERGG